MSPEQQRPVRHSVLRPRQRPEEIVYSGDDATDSLHLGAFLNGELVGIASVVREAPPGEVNTGAWRLRGMATLPTVRRQGYGAALVRACLVYAEQHGGTFLWCIGRTSALPFYTSLGFRPTGDEFESPGTGPHYIMRRAIQARADDS